MRAGDYEQIINYDWPYMEVSRNNCTHPLLGKCLLGQLELWIHTWMIDFFAADKLVFMYQILVGLIPSSPSLDFKLTSQCFLLHLIGFFKLIF